MTRSNLARAALVAAGMAMAGGALAETGPQAGQFILSPLATYVNTSADRDIDSGFGAGVGLGYMVNDQWGVEGFFSRTKGSNQVGPGEADISLYSVNGLFAPWQGERFRPYVLGGIGISDFERVRPGQDTDDFHLSFGAGTFLNVARNVEVRADVRGIYGTDDSEIEPVFTLGASLLLGGRDRPAPVIASAGPVDSDGDGVTDDRDRCPNTPPGTPVDADGCPIDGDADGDGVKDSKDQCPGTPPGTPVDEVGCGKLAAPVSINLNIEFDHDKSAIRPVYDPRIGEVVTFLKTYPNTRAVIEGHTDSTGSDAYNQALSERRANAVRDAVIQRDGIDPGRLTAVGHGEARPIADNATDEGRQRNRRVVAEISTAP